VDDDAHPKHTTQPAHPPAYDRALFRAARRSVARSSQEQLRGDESDNHVRQQK
jgi:hypothetical protein